MARDGLRILVCTGAANAEEGLVEFFSDSGATVQVVADRESYVAVAAKEDFDAILIDLPARGSASGAWREDVLVERSRRGGVVLAVPTEREADALARLGDGVDLYLSKPCTAKQAVAALLAVGERRRLRRRVRALEARTQTSDEVPVLVGCSPAVRRLAGVISRAGMNDATVLVEGKPGVGKSLVAELVHRNGRRAKGPLVTLECEGMEEAELDSGLTRAEGGTLVIENVDRLVTRVQSKLVRFLKDSTSTAQPGREIRVVATTSARLAELTAKGAFREDLYYRLNMFPVVVPSLTERREDIPLLARHFVERSAQLEGLPDRGFTAGAMILLEAHPWPGNVTQLKLAVTRAHQLADGGAIDRVHLFGPSTGVHAPPNVRGLNDTVDPLDSEAEERDEELSEDDIRPFQEEEKRLLARALRATRGNVRRAAQLLGIGRATLYRKIQIYQLRLQ